MGGGLRRYEGGAWTAADTHMGGIDLYEQIEVPDLGTCSLYW